jgi:hypothetical protein
MLEKSSWNASSSDDPQFFLKRLSQYTQLKLQLKINENRSTMLAVLERRKGQARLSLHKMFLTAPDEVVKAVALYAKGARKADIDYHRVLRSFIQSQLPLQDFTAHRRAVKLQTQGRVYNLQTICDEINHQYFNGKLTLPITWYGRGVRVARPRKITYGLYEDALKLIKIHKILDDPFFPPYFVSFVVYHEMLHAVIPGERDDRGNFCVHTRLFKLKEKEFVDYKRAREWEKQHIKQIFSHGRS